MITKAIKGLLIHFIVLHFSIYSTPADSLFGPLSSLLFHFETRIEEMNQGLSGETQKTASLTIDQNDIEALWETVFQSGESEKFSEAYQHSILGEANLQGSDFSSATEHFKQASIEIQKSLKKLKTGSKSKSLTYESEELERKASNSSFKNNPYISKKEKSAIKPYLLPDSHPIKPILDSLFSASRVTLNSTTLRNAGFTILHSRKRSFIKVVNHPLMPGYLFKLYLDDELRLKHGRQGWKWFSYRCQGARTIAKLIKKEKIKHFTVAKKWIYALPAEPAMPALPGHSRKNCILVAEDMQLVSKEENLAIWKNGITKKHLVELYDIISYAPGRSYRPDNIPYTKNGKFAFIDTEYPDHKPDYNSIRPYLSPDMLSYWDQLVKKGGK